MTTRQQMIAIFKADPSIPAETVARYYNQRLAYVRKLKSCVLWGMQ